MEIQVIDKDSAGKAVHDLLGQALAETSIHVETATQEQNAIIGIASVRSISETIAAKYIEFTSGARAYLETIAGVFAPALRHLEEIEAANKKACNEFHAKAGGEKTVKTEAGSLTYTERQTVIIDNEEDIPKNCMSPDPKKISAMLKAGLKVKGAHLEIAVSPTFRGLK